MILEFQAPALFRKEGAAAAAGVFPRGYHRLQLLFMI